VVVLVPLLLANVAVVTEALVVEGWMVELSLEDVYEIDTVPVRVALVTIVDLLFVIVKLRVTMVG